MAKKVNFVLREFISLLFNINYAFFYKIYWLLYRDVLFGIFYNFINTSEESSSLIELISFNLLLLSFIFNTYKHLN